MTPTRVITRAFAGVAALALSFGGAIGAFVLTAGPAAADTTNVTNTADDGTSTSLRGVLETADDGDIVVLTAGATYQLTICDPPVVKDDGQASFRVEGILKTAGGGAHEGQ